MMNHNEAQELLDADDRERRAAERDAAMWRYADTADPPPATDEDLARLDAAIARYHAQFVAWYTECLARMNVPRRAEAER